MGLFDKIRSSVSSASKNERYTPLSDYEAWVGMLYAAIAADGEVSEVEIDALIRLVLFKNKFTGLDIIPFYKNALQAKNQFGIQHIIDSCSLLIKDDDKPTLLALVAELILSDGIITDKEKEVIEYITARLNIDEPTAAKIIEVMLIKNKDNRVFLN